MEYYYDPWDWFFFSFNFHVPWSFSLLSSHVKLQSPPPVRTAFRIEIPAVSSASNSEDSSVFYWYSCSTLLIPSSGTFLKFICLLLILQSIRLCSPPFVFQKVVLKLRLCSVPCLQIGLAFHMCSLATFHPFCFNLPASLYLKWVSYSQHILGGVF